MTIDLTPDEAAHLLKCLGGPYGDFRLGQGLSGNDVLILRDKLQTLKPSRPYVPSHGERE